MPDCPKCGSSMVVKTARRGPNAGGKFYSCSRFPGCKGTRPFKEEDTPEVEPVQTTLRETVFPRTLVARERLQNYQVRFFETVAVPEIFLEKILYEDLEEGILKAFSQWRVDFPIRQNSSPLNERQVQIISVLEKILTRGRITLTSPKLEEELQKLSTLPANASFSVSLLEYLAYKGNKIKQIDPWLDSQEETIFYKDILPDMLKGYYQQFLLPQVEISSLISPMESLDTTGYRRVDFAIFHPRLKEKIIIEIDGAQHLQHIDADQERDNLLQKFGYKVIRIKTDEIQQRNGQQLQALESILSQIEENTIQSNELIELIHAIKLAHQIQIVLLQTIQSGFLKIENVDSWYIIADLDSLDLFDRETSREILNNAIADFFDLLNRLCRLYSYELITGKPKFDLVSDYTPDKTENAICISFADAVINIPTFYVQNIYFPYHIANSSFPTAPAIGCFKKTKEKDLKYFLKYLFRKEDFWEGQYDGITRALRGEDSLLLLPTGAGKSLVYQLASLLLPGKTVVIDPIISLMEDQIDNLAMFGIDRCIAITGQISDPNDRYRAIELFGQGEYLFAYVTPERFQITDFRKSLRTLTVHTPIALIVVDEAHCVSEWGHDFRTAYLNIGRTSRNCCESNGHIPPLLALTGTASRVVLKDVRRELQIQEFDAIITPKSFDRPELKFLILHSASQEKSDVLKGYLGQTLPSLFRMTPNAFFQTRGNDTYSGLVFCPYVGSEFGVVQVSEEIGRALSISTTFYSGKEPNHWNHDEYIQTKHRRTKQFKRNNIPLLVCTKAFGMGIDKPNIRFTIHYGIPPSIESFYQEAGRAGRNRETAFCCIIVSNDEPERTKVLLNPNTKIEEIDGIVRNTEWDENDDITRVLYFHTKSFRGTAQEKQYIEEVLIHLGDIRRKERRMLTIPEKIREIVKKEVRGKKDVSGQARKVVEKGLHRLLIIGVVSDYTIEYSHNEFTVRLSGANKDIIIEKYGEYVESYLTSRRQIEVNKAKQFLKLPLIEFIKQVISLLLHFIYDVIEKGRRSALNEMFITCTTLSKEEDIRGRILRYFEVTEFSERLEQVIADENAGLVKSKDIIVSVRSQNEAAELRGQVSRYLESYPDHPALLMLRSLSEILSRDRSVEVVKQNYLASISSALESYKLSPHVVFDFSAWAVLFIGKHNTELTKELIANLLQSYPIRDFARKIIKELPLNLIEMPAWFLLARIQKNCASLLLKKGE